ncbi:hypothetical protein CHLRE_07g329476v5 [Chlamydomonas reinhardtii]|uniref:Uncharacterized protein n=1 Tax=Chlamydomonas reinhardtii TaxID=3055 RepID=A0A2K3DJR8_CHLRE|nr:uncharacterized protein CHLRE_07g329476v5 [Chlamydomonas reinhardtii]PNW80780.1 hypothetical protein CHLRE_07g329476v5 [Chlamydomonas reinhardtii]
MASSPPPAPRRLPPSKLPMSSGDRSTASTKRRANPAAAASWAAAAGPARVTRPASRRSAAPLCDCRGHAAS